MDSFLSDLYKESMEKRAGAELKEFYDSCSIDQLEQILGITKVAVEGPTKPECPDGSPVGKYLDAKEKAPAKKTTPPEMPTAASSTAKTAGEVEPTTVFDRMQSGKQENKTAKAKNSTVFDQLEGKVAADLTLKKRESLPSAKFAIPEAKAKKIGVAGEIVGSSKGKYPIPDAAHARNALARVAQHGTPAEKAIVHRKVHAKFPGIGEKNAAFECADQVGRMFAKTSAMNPALLQALILGGGTGALTGAGVGAASAEEGQRGVGALKGALMGGAAGVPLGHLGTLGGEGLATLLAKKRLPSMGQFLLGGGLGGLAGGAVGGTAGGVAAPLTAEKRAEFLITALRATKNAPEHVKHAAAKYVGERL